jgi:hypothetical protein
MVIDEVQYGGVPLGNNNLAKKYFDWESPNYDEYLDLL